MKKIFLVLIFIPLLLTAHIQDEDLFKTARVPAAAILALDRSGSMMVPIAVPGMSVELKRQSWSRPGSSENLVGWYDSTLTSYENMNNFDVDTANGDWILSVSWEEYGRWTGSSSLSLSWRLSIRDGSGWHEYDGGSNSWTGTGATTKRDTITVAGLENIVDVLCYVDITTGDGLKIDNVGISLMHTPGAGAPTRRMESALLVIHSLLDVNSDGLVDGNDEFPVKLGQGFFYDARVRVGRNKTYEYNASLHNIKCDSGMNWPFEPVEWDQENKIWVNGLVGSQELRADTIGSTPATIWNHINTTAVNSSTPDGMLVDSAVHYINQYRSIYDTLGLWCMKYSIVLVTDGIPNVPRNHCHQSTNVSGWGIDDYEKQEGSKDLVRAAYLAFHKDNDGNGKVDSIQVFAVGFGTSIDQDCANVLNWTARWGKTQSADSAFIDSMINIESMDTMAVNPTENDCCNGIDPRDELLTGYAYIAEDAEDLASALRSIFMGIESQRARSFTSVEVTSIEEEFLATGYEARMYLASFYPDSTPFWEGHLQAIKLVEGGLSLDTIPDSLKIWDAGDSLRKRKPSERNIYGIKSGSEYSFNASNFSAADLGVGSEAERDEVINLVRCGKSFADTLSYLGDIFHSAPLRVGAPSFWFRDDEFVKYRDSVSSRNALIFAGSNTGMLHAFSEETGEEKFAIIPENFVPEVKALSDSHRFYVDADPMAADIWFPEEDADSFKDSDEWKTVLMAAQGEGGRGITCLDVTDPDSVPPTLLFSFYDTNNIGYTTSVPVMYKVRRMIGINTVERFFAFFGGGEWPDSMYNIYSPGSDVRGNVIVAVDIQDASKNPLSQGSNFWYIPVVTEDAGKMIYPFASAATVINLNSRVDNLYDLLYIPDLAGQLWKVDLSDSIVSNWEARCIFQPTIPADLTQDSLWQPAFFAPLVEKEPVTGGLWLFYGTGDRAKIFRTPTDNRFYAILDDMTDSVMLTEDSLKSVWTDGAFDFPDDLSNYGGWYVRFADSSGHSDEKVVSQASLFIDTLAIVTFEPSEASGDCNMGVGGAREYFFHFRTGGGRSRNMGAGIPQAPRYSFDQSGGGYVVHQTSDSLWVESVTGLGTLKRVLQWKER